MGSPHCTETPWSARTRHGTPRHAGWSGLILLAALLAGPSTQAAQDHVLPFFTPAGDVQEGFARIINHSPRSGTVSITGTDDAGGRYGPVTLSLGARQTRHFNSGDLERGNAAKGLSGGLGDGEGYWRLSLESELDLEVGAYIRTADGFLSSVHDVVPTVEVGGETVHRVSVFNPGSNRNQVSWLRLVNLTRDRVRVSIQGRDDEGRAAPGGEVSLTLPAAEARHVSAQQLESGAAGLTGRLGDGEGKWQLFVRADGDIEVGSAVQTPSGHLTNLSVPGRRDTEAREAEPPPAVGTVFRDCPGCPEMVVVPSGTYRMGSPADEAERDADEGPVRGVTIGEPFAVGRYEVTIAQWDACYRAGGCSHRPDDQGWGRGSRPVVDVSWDDAQEYVRWLSGQTGRAYRLPSEAEWEYVARAGTTTRFWWGDEIGRNRANCDGCGSAWDARQTAPVGSFSANAFGLHDVHGNAWEWVQDCRNRNNYVGAPIDGSAHEWSGCDARGIRGGSWQSGTIPRYLRSANRGQHTADSRSFLGVASVGFRVVRSLGAPVRHTLALFRPAGQTQQGFARIINRSNRAGSVQIWGTDDAGKRRGPVRLSLDALATRQFNSGDLERGNAAKGLSGGLGNGTGDWRLDLESALDLEPSAYIRTPDGFLTAMHAVARSAEVGGETVHQVPIFNPGSNRHQVSWLRVANLGDSSTRVTIRGRDDAGRPAPSGEVRLTLPAHGARRISARQLESGTAGLSGRFGEGTGKWQLAVSADGPIEVVSLLQSPTGHLSNLSTTPGGAPPSTGDGNDTIAEALDVAVGETVSGRIDSAGDVDYFRLQVAHSGTLVVWTGGEVATELELLDPRGNPLASAARSSATRSSGATGQLVAKREVLNPLFWDEIGVQARDTIIAKVTSKGRLGGFALGSRQVRVNVTNVNRDNPAPTGVHVRSGTRGVKIDMAVHLDNPNEIRVDYSVSTEHRVGRSPLNVGFTVSGSEVTIIAPESGPAYSGPVTIKVRVTETLLGLPFAEFEFPIQFTREEAPGNPGGLGCAEVQVTPNSDRESCRSILGVDGPSYRATITNICSQPVYVIYEWSNYSDDSPEPVRGSRRIGPGGTGSPFSTRCISGAAPTLSTCTYYSDLSLCRDF